MAMKFAPWLVLFMQLPTAGAQDSVEDVATSDWPKEIPTRDGTLVVYEPQIESLHGDRLSARMAVSVEGGDRKNPIFGGVWIDARVLTDRDRRTVRPVEVTVKEVRFPQAAPSEQDFLRKAVSAELPKWPLTFAMDELREHLRLVEHEKAAALHLKNDPPEILCRNHAAVLVEIEGDPAWRPLPGTPSFRISNSAFFMVREGRSGPYSLHVPPYWWTASAPLGPWRATDVPPDWAETAWAAEPRPEPPAPDSGAEVPERPEVVVVTRPTELLVTQGPPEYLSIPGTDLLYVQNTDDDVFLESRSQYYYILLSGRWYRKQAGKGSWTYVPPGELPTDFSRIPPDSPKAHVLACVAGTTDANDALLDAQIPQTAAVAPGSAEVLEVPTDGSPQYESVPGLGVDYIVNTPCAVFRVAGRHFCCQEGVWYESSLATGPWSVSKRVPNEIYLLPPSCPYYFCSYCHVFGATPDAIWIGYYPGYRGCYVEGATVVYGTGWHYRPWIGPGACYPRPVTWNTGVRYSRQGAAWTFGLGGTGPYAWLGLQVPSGFRDHPYPVGVGGCWGGASIRRLADDVHRSIFFSARVPEGIALNIYARRPALLAHLRDHLPPPTRPPLRERRLPNNVYTDREGNVFRHLDGGAWEQHHPEGWKRVAPPAVPSTPHELPRMDSLRQELQQQRQVRDRGLRPAEASQPQGTPRPRSSPPVSTPPHR
jgi:hypothetical protein